MQMTVFFFASFRLTLLLRLPVFFSYIGRESSVKCSFISAVFCVSVGPHMPRLLWC